MTIPKERLGYLKGEVADDVKTGFVYLSEGVFSS
jgi:hypothetical protein